MEHKRSLVVTLAGVATVVGIVTALWPYLPKFQTVEAAEAHEKDNHAVAAGLAVGQARIETFVLRGQVNQCVTQTRSLKGEERDICDGYRREYEQSEKRLQMLQQEALPAKRNRP